MKKLLVMLLLVASCKTCPPPVDCPKIPLIERPASPTEERVVFVEKDGGAWLSRTDLEALIRNVTELKRYAKQAEAVILYYEKAVTVQGVSPAP